MANKFYNFIELKYSDLTSQINSWIKNVYSKSELTYNSASPYGQILNVMKELFQHNLIYLKNAIKVLDIEQTQNKKVAQQTARIAGHNPGRAISATGTLKFTLKQGVDISKEIKDSILIVEDGLVMKNITNSLKYCANLTTPSNIYPITIANNSFYIPIIQGSYESQRFTANGKTNQSYSVNIPGNKQIENFNFFIRYNGRVITIKDGMWDMNPGTYECFVRSGFNGGIDIYFGNENYGFIPQRGASIEVRYLLSDGSDGEIFNPVLNDFKVEGEIRDGQGNELDIKKLFNISIQTDINFASDGESLDFTKSAVPFVSRNYVLGTPSQFIFHLRRLNMFSKVNAYNKLEDNNFSVTDNVVEDSMKQLKKDINSNESRSKILSDLDNFNRVYSEYKNNLNDNEIYLYLIPAINKYFNDNINYFNIPFDVFYLDDDEQSKIMSYLRQIGTLSPTTEINIVQPKISRYVMHVYIRRFDYANEDNIKQEIIAKTSEYLLTTNRFDRIPKSDFINIYKDIDGVDSASVFFVSKKNEDYHRKSSDLGYTPPPKKMKYESGKFYSSVNNVAKFNAKIEPILAKPMKMKNGILVPNQTYDQNLLLGIDNVHGDIIIEKDEYALIRGGWRDRKGIWYNEDTTDNSLNSINIVFDGITTLNQ